MSNQTEQHESAPYESEPYQYESALNAAAVPLWKRRPIQLGTIATVAAAAIGIYFATSSRPGTIHVHGALNLGLLAAGDTTNPSNPTAGDSCEATGGYSDITQGATVTIGAQTGQTLAIGALSSGIETASGYCAFSFDIAVPASQSAYTVTISHRGTQTFTPAQAAQPIELSLGS